MLVCFSHSFAKYILPAYSIPGAVLVTRHEKMFEYDQCLDYFGVNCLGERVISKKSCVSRDIFCGPCGNFFFTKLLLARK